MLRKMTGGSAFAILLAALLASPGVCAIIRVKPDGSNGDGSTWSTAKTTVQAGIDAAGNGGEVWVAKGLYVERITLKSGVAVYGGFAGTEALRSERPPFPRTPNGPNESTLDGDALGSVVTVQSQASSATALDGFTITNGTGSVAGGTSRGGGIYCGLGSPVITNNVITSNQADQGGGIYCFGGSPTIKSNEISGNSSNQASGLGGAICCVAASAGVFNNFIRDSRATDGGALYVSGGSTLIVSNLLVANSASQNGGAICAVGSGTYSAINNTLVGNSAAAGGAVCCQSSSTMGLKNNLFSGNRAAEGDCLWRDLSSNPSVLNCCFWENGDQPFYPTSWNPVGSNGNLQTDPLFLAPWVAEYHLRTGSPCINAGDDTALQAGWTDLDDKTRKLDTHVDIGCFEYDAAPYWIRSLGQARAVPYGINIKLNLKPITATFPGAFYIEEYDRTAGLRVQYGGAVTLGHRATVVGSVNMSQDAELQIEATSVTTQSDSTANLPRPVQMSNRALGGGPYYFSVFPEEIGQPGLVYANGLNNIALLTRTTGEVTARGPSDWFYVDDGSGVDDLTGQIGVYVSVPSGVTPPAIGSYVVVTGISACALSFDYEVVGVLRARGGGDVWSP